MNQDRLAGKVVVVTGGFGVLGRAVAQEALAQGARVALLGHAPQGSEGFQVESGRVLALPEVELTSPEAVQAALEQVNAQLGGLDALVNVAGTFRYATLAESDLATWSLLLDANLKTAVVVAKAALPYLLAAGQGRIVNIGANSAVKAGAGMGAYAASKSAVARLTESLAEELKDHGITVNAVLPSIIDTPQNRADMPKADFSRWVPPAAIAEVIAFLLSDAAQAVTGALIPVTGRT